MVSSAIPGSATLEHLLCRIHGLMMFGSEQHMFSLIVHRDGNPAGRAYHKQAWSAIAGITGAYDDVVSDIVGILQSQQ
eukprot:7597574-Ditylum_brightwellii.AAC.1